MSDPRVEPVDTAARIQLRGWLGDAAALGVDVDDAETIQAAYEQYFDRVLGTPEDQRGDPTPTLTAIAMALGEHLRRNSPADWRIVTDDQGRDLALASPDAQSILFPIDPIAASWEQQQRLWLRDFVDAAVTQFADRPTGG
ncbi:DUF3806 domain-containing protein [Calidifontibacter terrae]